VVARAILVGVLVMHGSDLFSVALLHDDGTIAMGTPPD